ncbi:hypothetical protein Pth03_80900 [Planotetraspora thailandica]|uniref:DUF1622 domain-containing protein n=1 Tax=Planotetraspora thailandica TaxID=487172 RepID=A0A8J4DFU7_9ACTN|nr:DUF1622 domain-containing protein [Planotetraspora thailandica]GII59701.1 hypothetical protein Pth03_80900 [Planotetraspora thailandica]
MDFQHVVQWVGVALEGAGVAVIFLGALAAAVAAIVALGRGRTDVYTGFRRRLGRSILLGLEFLVAGDITRTVAVSPTYASLGLLAIVVAIRTFLSFSLEMEISGRWPWQRG